MKLTIVAATGGVGRHVLEQAFAAGHDVTAVVRNPAGLPNPPKRDAGGGHLHPLRDLTAVESGAEQALHRRRSHGRRPAPQPARLDRGGPALLTDKPPTGSYARPTAEASAAACGSLAPTPPRSCCAPSTNPSRSGIPSPSRTDAKRSHDANRPPPRPGVDPDFSLSAAGLAAGGAESEPAVVPGAAPDVSRHVGLWNYDQPDRDRGINVAELRCPAAEPGCASQFPHVPAGSVVSLPQLGGIVFTQAPTAPSAAAPAGR